jgi:hypothetical protein
LTPTLEAVPPDLAALRWISGRPTPHLPLILHILALPMACSLAAAPTAVMAQTDMTVSATRTVVISTPSVWETRPSMVHQRLLTPPRR